LPLSSTFVTSITNQPEGGGYNRSILGLSKDFLILFMGQSKMPMKKEEKWNFETRDN
jgi:hypothetical protein